MTTLLHARRTGKQAAADMRNEPVHHVERDMLRKILVKPMRGSFW